MEESLTTDRDCKIRSLRLAVKLKYSRTYEEDAAIFILTGNWR
jgi:hypothetical protein